VVNRRVVVDQVTDEASTEAEERNCEVTDGAVARGFGSGIGIIERRDSRLVAPATLLTKCLPERENGDSAKLFIKICNVWPNCGGLAPELYTITSSTNLPPTGVALLLEASVVFPAPNAAK
jgi:hypothetical protein